MITITGREFGAGGAVAGSLARAGTAGRARSLFGRVRELFQRPAYDSPEEAFAARHRLWPAIEHACEMVKRELGLLRVTMQVREYPGEPAYLSVRLVVPCDDFQRMVELEAEIMPALEGRCGRRIVDRLLVSVTPDPTLFPG